MPAEKDTMYEIVIANDNLSSYKVRAADERPAPSPASVAATAGRPLA